MLKIRLMNIKSIILSTTALAVILTVAFTLKTETQFNSYYEQAKAEKSVKEVEGAQGAIDFFHEMRANPLTGKIESEDIEAAIQEVYVNRNNASKTTAFPTMEWEERGPDNIGGRTRAVIVDNSDPNKLYMGQVSGGFWTSPDGGNTWSKMTGMDSATRLSVSCIAQTPNGDIYYGTGESFANISGVGFSSGIPGGGIFKSTDGGVTSTLLPATKPPFDADNTRWTYINRLAPDPNNSDHIYAGINRGFYETNDAGVTWTPVISSSIPMLDVDVSNTGNVILTSSNSQMFLSTDGGANFEIGINSSSRGLPGPAGINRIEVAIAPSNENIMYCVMSASATGGLKGIYKSIDKGQNWNLLGPPGGSQAWNPLGSQGGYNIALGVHPTNPDVVFLGGQFELFRWNGNSLNPSWQAIAFWIGNVPQGAFVHADMHGIQFGRSNPDEMYVITDGGFFRTADCLAPTPFFIEKNKDYATVQCYGVAANNLGHIIFGAQDNGTNIINGAIANSPKRAKDAMGGDGMRGAASDINTNYLFGTSQFGNLESSADGGTSTASFNSIWDGNIDTDGDGNQDENGLWISPVTLAENANGTATKSVLFIGLENNVWFCPTAVGSGTKTWFPLHRAANNYTAIAVSEDGNTAFVGTSNGSVFRITGTDFFGRAYRYDDDSSATYGNIFTGALAFNNFSMDTNFVTTQITGPWSGHITDLECDETGNELLITTARYGVANHIFRSTNALAPTPVVNIIQGSGSGKLPSMPVYTAVILDQPNHYLVGTDLGVWGTENGGATWIELNNISGAENTWHPRAAVLQIAVKPFLDGPNGFYGGQIVYTGTYGRGTFMSKSMASLWPVSTRDVKKEENNLLSIYPNPVNTTANITYDASKSGDAMIRVISLSGRVIKTTFADVQAGENKISFDMSGLSKGVYMLAVTSVDGTLTSKVIKR